MAETTTIWMVGDDIEIPDNADPANGIVGYTIEAQFPEMDEPEQRTLHTRMLGPDDDVATIKAIGLSATQLIGVEGNLGMLGIWWLAGRQEGKRETYRELAPRFTSEAVDAFVKNVGVVVELKDPDAADGDAPHDDGVGDTDPS